MKTTTHVTSTHVGVAPGARPSFAGNFAFTLPIYPSPHITHHSLGPEVKQCWQTPALVGREGDRCDMGSAGAAPTLLAMLALIPGAAPTLVDVT